MGHRSFLQWLLPISLIGVAAGATPQSYTVNIIAGGQIPATVSYSGSMVVIPSISDLAADSAGNVYFSSNNAALAGSNVIFKLDPQGKLTRIAGDGTVGFSGDGGPATAAKLKNPTKLAVDRAGNLYFLDGIRVRRISPNGVIATVAGNGVSISPPTPYVSGDGGPAVDAVLYSPLTLGVDAPGNLYIATVPGVRKVTTDGIISTMQGMSNPPTLVVGPAATFYSSTIGGTLEHILFSILKLIPGHGTIQIPTGIPSVGSAASVDGAENVYITFNQLNQIAIMDSAGTTKIVAGTGQAGDIVDGSPAATAALYAPNKLVTDAAGNYYFTDGVPRVWKVNKNGILTQIATGVGDGGPAAFAALNAPRGLSRDVSGNLYLVEGNRVRKIDPQGNISQFAGTGVGAKAASGKLAAQTFLSGPSGVAPDRQGNVYITDSFGIHKVDSSGILTTIAPKPTSGGWGAITVDPSNTIYAYLSDINSCVQKVSPAGVLTPITACDAGTSFVEGGPAIGAHLQYIRAMTTDDAGNLYLAGYYQIVKISTAGVITTVAGTGSCSGNFVDGIPATEANFCGTAGIAFDKYGSLFIGDSYRSRVWRISSNGSIAAVAGTGDSGWAARTVPGPALSVPIVPSSLVSDGLGGVFVADANHGTVIDLVPAGQPTMNVSVSHADSFPAGSVGTFTIVPSNIAPSPLEGLTGGAKLLMSRVLNVNTAGTEGVVTVKVSLSTGGPPFSLSGEGWICAVDTCTRNDTLPPGSSYPPITATVQLTAGSPAQLTLKAAITGGGAPPTGGQDTAQIIGPQLNVTNTHAGVVYAGQVNAISTVKVFNAGTSATTDPVAVIQTAPTGFTVTSMSGTGWKCEANSCTRADGLAAGDSFPPITVTMNVRSDAVSPQISSVIASGGGSANAIATDTIVVGPAHPAFFNGEVTLSEDSWTWLQSFGYYNHSGSQWIYHLDLGWLYFMDANDGHGGVYFADSTSQHIWYTNPGSFPFLYDFTLKTWIYYFPDPKNAGRYSNNPRQFANMTTGQLFSM